MAIIETQLWANTYNGGTANVWYYTDTQRQGRLDHIRVENNNIRPLYFFIDIMSTGERFDVTQPPQTASDYPISGKYAQLTPEECRWGGGEVFE